MQVRDRFWIPPPQVAEQELHPSQSDHRPSTTYAQKKKKEKMYSERKSVSALQSVSTDVTSICVTLLE